MAAVSFEYFQSRSIRHPTESCGDEIYLQKGSTPVQHHESSDHNTASTSVIFFHDARWMVPAPWSSQYVNTLIASIQIESRLLIEKYLSPLVLFMRMMLSALCQAGYLVMYREGNSDHWSLGIKSFFIITKMPFDVDWTPDPV
ncbi:hypothetical protein TNCV_4740651 [Trichonephila clavipes]|nr:hypothetical protein TNCV_4740651 [Trichonephila clavipes]